MTVITMTREMGSLGKDVASGVAAELGLQVVYHEFIERDIADRMKLGESDVHRFLERKPSLSDRRKIDKDQLSHYTAEEIYDIALEGNAVIRGWGAIVLLRSVPHILRVRVCAPMSFRVRVMKDRLGLENEQDVRREIERNDTAHTRALHGLLKSEWQGALNYDLVLNTERVPISDCVRQVVALAGSAAFEKTTSSQQILSDLIIEHRARNAIASKEELAISVRNVDISFGDGELVLTGLIEDRKIGQALYQELKGISGVKSIIDNLTVLSAYRG